MKKISVVLSCYNEPFYLIRNCLQSILSQKDIQLNVLLLNQLNRKLENLKSIENKKNFNINFQDIPNVSIAYARNYGAKKSTTPFVAFCDPDCTYTDNWAIELYKALDKQNVAVAGGKILPTSSYRWFFKSKLIQEFYGILDLSDQLITTDQIIGCKRARWHSL